MSLSLPSLRRAACLAAATACLMSLAQAQDQASPDAALSAGPAPAEGKTDFSAAERLLLMSDQLSGLKPPTTLSYRFRKSGPLEPGFEDRVDLKLQKQPDGSCCTASSEFLTGERRMNLPDLEQARGNPVILYFLEHDIRDMNRRTKGASAYFRKRIRMALYESATVKEVQLQYRGKAVAGQEIQIRPYANDPNQSRFAKFTGKQYVFVLSPDVPGGVALIRSSATEAGASAPFIEEELRLEGAEASRPAGAKS